MCSNEQAIAANLALETTACDMGYACCKWLHVAAKDEYEEYIRRTGLDSIDAPQQFSHYHGAYFDLFSDCLDSTIQGMELFLSREHTQDVTRYESRLKELKVLQSLLD